LATPIVDIQNVVVYARKLTSQDCQRFLPPISDQELGECVPAYVNVFQRLCLQLRMSGVV